MMLLVNNWNIIATDTAFAPRINAVAFSANGKGYVGTGRDDNSVLSDFWSYDPDLNKWSRIADIPVNRYGAVAFSIGNLGFVGTGYNSKALLDFYSYDPATNLWAQISNYPVQSQGCCMPLFLMIKDMCVQEKITVQQ